MFIMIDYICCFIECIFEQLCILKLSSKQILYLMPLFVVSEQDAKLLHKLCSPPYRKHRRRSSQNIQEEIFSLCVLFRMFEPEGEPPLPLADKQRAMMHSEKLILIKRSQIPKYLRKSELYLSFSNDDDEEIPVPYNCMKMDLEFNGVCDLEHLLLTMRFWIKKYFPDEAILFMLKSHSLKTNILLQRHKLEHPTVVSLLACCDVHNQCILSCTYGRLDFFEFFLKRGVSASVEALQAAASGGHLDCLMHVYKVFGREKLLPLNWPKVNVLTAASAGYLTCLQFLINEGLPATVALCVSAAGKNQLAVLKYLLEVRTAKNEENIAPYEVWAEAASSESESCLEYLIDTFPTQIRATELAKLACHLHKPRALNALLSRNCISLPESITIAAQMGSMKSLKYLHKVHNANCWVNATIIAAAEADRLELVLRLLRYGCTCDTVLLRGWVHTQLQALPQAAPVVAPLRRHYNARKEMLHDICHELKYK